jgi:FkbM family methyltransferase
VGRRGARGSRARALLGAVLRHPRYALWVALALLRRPDLCLAALRRGWRAALRAEMRRLCPAAGDLITPYEAGFFGQVFLFDEYEVGRLRLPPRPTVVDVGANVGFFAWRVAALRPGARLLALEPEAGNHARLVRLLQALGIPAETPRCAAGAAPGTATLYLRNSVTHSLDAEWHRDLDAGAGTETVEVTTIDLECARRGIEEIDVLKIDTEGAEADVLGGAAEMLPRTRHVVLEYHSPQRRAACLAILRAAGFLCREKSFWGAAAARGQEGLLLCRRAGQAAAPARAAP